MKRPHTRHCPLADCPSHAPGARSRVIRHARFRTRRGWRLRLLCRVCQRTFAATLGTAYYPLLPSLAQDIHQQWLEEQVPLAVALPGRQEPT